MIGQRAWIVHFWTNFRQTSAKYPNSKKSIFLGDLETFHQRDPRISTSVHALDDFERSIKISKDHSPFIENQFC